MIEARVYVTLRKGVLDAQGDTVRSALESLGFSGVQDVRIGKFMVLTLDGGARSEVEATVHAMCQQLLANPVIEDYRFELHDSSSSSPSPRRGDPSISLSPHGGEGMGEGAGGRP